MVAVQEVDELAILEDVAADLGGYTAYLREGNDNRGIDVGFLVKDTVTASNVRQWGRTRRRAWRRRAPTSRAGCSTARRCRSTSSATACR